MRDETDPLSPIDPPPGAEPRAEIPPRAAEGLRDLLAVVNSDRAVDEILDYLLEQADRLLGSSAGAVYLLEDGADVLAVRSARGP